MELPIIRVSDGALIGTLGTSVPFSGCIESEKYMLSVPREGAQLYVDDERLEKDEALEQWLWQPGFYAGEVLLELDVPGRSKPLRYLVDVGPSAAKTGRAQYAEYLAQIVDFLPQLITGSEPAQHGLGGYSPNYINIWLRYARMRHFIERYLSGLNQISARPIVRARYHRRQTSLATARRVDAVTLRRLVATPELLTALSDIEWPESMADPLDKLLDVPFHQPTMDNPANRLMARQLKEVHRQLRRLIGAMQNYSHPASETKTDVMPRIPRRVAYLRQVERKLIRASRSFPFRAARLDKSGVAALIAVSGQPHYSMTHRTGARILRQGLSELANDEQHYLAPTWEIYEAWCFVAIAEQLQKQTSGFSWSLDVNVQAADLLLHGKAGHKSIRLFSQMVCYSMEKPNIYGYCSISRERRPDLLLEIVDKKGHRFVCLDSKYSSSRSAILNAMASAHIYRDSLRFGRQRPDLSLILVPANLEVPELGSVDYKERHGLSCEPMSNNDHASVLVEKLLREFLSDRSA